MSNKIPQEIMDQMLKANDAYDNAHVASTAMMNGQKEQNDRIKAAQEASTALMVEHKKLSDMVKEWRGKEESNV